MMTSISLIDFVDIVWRTAVVLAIGWLAIRLIRKQPAQLRYELAIVTMTAALLVPVLHTVLPGIAIIPAIDVPNAEVVNALSRDVSLQEQALSREGVNAVSSGSVLDDAARDATPFRESSNGMVEALGFLIEEARSLSIWEMAFLVWLSGVVVMLLHVSISRFRLYRVWRTATPVAHSGWESLLEEAGDRVFLTRDVVAREIEGIQSPMTWGIWSPRLLVPAHIHDWSRERQLNAVMHEFVHVRRLDAVHDTVASLVLALNWFNPLAWMMRSTVKASREASCDAEVLGLGAQPEEYAHMLIDVAKGMRSNRGRTMLAMSMARPTQLEGRVLSILNYAPVSTSATSRRVMIGLLTLTVLFTSAATMRPNDSLDADIVDHSAAQQISTLPEYDEDLGNERSMSAASSAHSEDLVSDSSSDAQADPRPVSDPWIDGWKDDALPALESKDSDAVDPIGDLFAVAGIKLADAVMNEIGQSLEEIDWASLLEEANWDIDWSDVDQDGSEILNPEQFEEALKATSESDVERALGRLSDHLQNAVIIELEKTIRDNPGTDKSRRARKALVAIDSDASRDALRRLGMMPIPR